MFPEKVLMYEIISTHVRVWDYFRTGFAKWSHLGPWKTPSRLTFFYSFKFAEICIWGNLAYLLYMHSFFSVYLLTIYSFILGIQRKRTVSLCEFGKWAQWNPVEKFTSFCISVKSAQFHSLYSAKWHSFIPHAYSVKSPGFISCICEVAQINASKFCPK